MIKDEKSNQLLQINKYIELKQKLYRIKQKNLIQQELKEQKVKPQFSSDKLDQSRKHQCLMLQNIHHLLQSSIFITRNRVPSFLFFLATTRNTQKVYHHFLKFAKYIIQKPSFTLENCTHIPSPPYILDACRWTVSGFQQSKLCQKKPCFSIWGQNFLQPTTNSANYNHIEIER